MSKQASVWLIIPQTNLHVGDESVGNYSIIDKTIQRDATTHLPCINSSSLKGAIKEFLNYHKKEDGYPKNEKIAELFGSSKEDKNNSQKGSAIFFDAQLLYIPKQMINNNSPYTLACTSSVLCAFADKARNLGVCDVETKVQNTNLIKGHSTPIKMKDFQELCDDDHLPIIARNYLENGESKNLWYEQVLPSMSVLGTIILTDNEQDLNVLNDKIVQIGANATIGYGYCRFIKL
jgi:CRISPR-associated protein Cmr4